MKAPANPSEKIVTRRPALSWEGQDLIGQKARIDGDPQHGFELRYFDEETEAWRPPSDLDEYRWIVEAFLADALTRTCT